MTSAEQGKTFPTSCLTVRYLGQSVIRRHSERVIALAGAIVRRLHGQTRAIIALALPAAEPMLSALHEDRAFVARMLLAFGFDSPKATASNLVAHSSFSFWGPKNSHG